MYRSFLRRILIDLLTTGLIPTDLKTWTRADVLINLKTQHASEFFVTLYTSDPPHYHYLSHVSLYRDRPRRTADRPGLFPGRAPYPW
jgi:hypothetical protein